MRKLLTLAGLVFLGSVVGCQSCGTGCSSCGCGSGCGGGGAWARSGDHHTCTAGVCDCDLPPLAPYGRPAAAPPPVAPAPAVVQSGAIPREMPLARDDAPSK
jgi:hypothetical protein